jgi:hypothetical protein
VVIVSEVREYWETVKSRWNASLSPRSPQFPFSRWSSHSVSGQFVLQILTTPAFTHLALGPTYSRVSGLTKFWVKANPVRQDCVASKPAARPKRNTVSRF